MAEIIPPLNQQTLSRMTPGKKRVARRFETLLEDDYLVYYDNPVVYKINNTLGIVKTHSC